MYTDFFSLTEKPFSITPDPAYLFLSKRHEEALAHLIYGVTDSGGFIQLTGEVGTGKTMIIRSLFDQLPENVDIALIVNPRLSVNEFLHAICDELSLPVEKEESNKYYFDILNGYLLQAYSKGRKVVLLVDEAQNLSVEVMEQIRLLTNLETSKDKLLQIILVGQPELEVLLQRQDLRQLAQRITARYYLKSLNKPETRAYIKHRLGVAGAKYNIFKPSAEFLIYKESQGIPRLINIISDRALLGAYSQQQPSVDTAIAKQAIKEVLGEAKQSIQKESVKKENSFSLTKLLWLPLIALAGFGLWAVMPQIMNLNNSDEFSTNNTSQQSNRVIVSEPDTQKVDALEELATTEAQEVTSVITQTPELSLENNEVNSELKTTELNTKPEITDLTSLLQDHSQLTTAEEAFNQLLITWGRSKFYEHANACENIKLLGLRCLYTQGRWELIVKYNRPFIIELLDTQNIKHQLLIKSVIGEIVTTQIDGVEYQLNLDQVLSYSQASYLVFWQPEDLNAEGLFVGMNTDSILMLRKQLSTLGMNIEPQSESLLFDADLVTSVKNFQKSVGLVDDGIVGSRTFIYLNNALGLPNRPNLTGSK